VIPGELFTAPGEIEINAGRATVTLRVANTGDRPIQVGSHYHFYETNAALAFDRERASGFAHTLGFWWSVASLEYYMGYVDNMAQQSLADLRAYARRYIVGKPHITGVLIAPEARQALRLAPTDLVMAGTR